MAPLSPNSKDKYLAAQAEQLKAARWSQRNLDSIDKGHIGGCFEDDQIAVEIVKDYLVRNQPECRTDCMCKLSKFVNERHHRDPRSPATQVISHRFHGGKLFLLCVLDSGYSRPEYLRLCQVSEEVRTAYRDYLEENGNAPIVKEHWNIQKEAELFQLLYEPLDSKHARQQEELRQCVDTVDWCERTHNGKNALVLPPTGGGVVDRPPAAMENEEGEFWEVEDVLGSLIEKKTGKLWFLIKWKGYPNEENSWEPHHGLQMTNELIQHFYNTYGRPTSRNPKIVSPDGAKFEKWVKEYEKERQSQKRRKN